MTIGTPEYLPIMTLRPVLGFVVTVAVTVTGITRMPVDELWMF
jgi:hypothetical protein